MLYKHAVKVPILGKFLFLEKVIMANSGESMENALRACCKCIKIMKILIHREGDIGQQEPQGIHVVCKRFPRIKIMTFEIEIGLNEDFWVIPGMGKFGDRYFGTDDDDQ
ncbi:hypothetical protein RJT34_17212 [Clitoria ternatea]|uniref:Phosphoribosyltransferase domain-containing protein n=1 Tax=Clitoria ternatea TaxID=43366 RepID=A0AAN9J8W6_CLITE